MVLVSCQLKLEYLKDYRGRNKSCYSIARRKVEHGLQYAFHDRKVLQYAFRDRKARKNTFRSLWIQRINAAARQFDLCYAKLMKLLSQHNVALDRKMLAELAVNEPNVFADLVAQIRGN